MTSGATVFVSVVGALVGGVAVSGRLVASGWTDHFMASGGSEGDGTAVASGSSGAPSGSSGAPSEGSAVGVKLSARSSNEFNGIGNAMPNPGH